MSTKTAGRDAAGVVGTARHIDTKPLRIGEVAELTGVTPRTIRYYEEIGLLPGESDRPQGGHRTYSEQDVERLHKIVRLKELLGLSLDQLSTLLEAEDAREELRREYHRTDDRAKRHAILRQSATHIASQLELVRARKAELDRLEAELVERQELVATRLAQ